MTHHGPRCIGYVCTCRAALSYGDEWIKRTTARLQRAYFRAMKGVTDEEERHARLWRITLHAVKLAWVSATHDVFQP